MFTWLKESRSKVVPTPLTSTVFTVLRAALCGAYPLIALDSNIRKAAYDRTGINGMSKGYGLGVLRVVAWVLGWVVNTRPTPYAKLSWKWWVRHLGSGSKNEVVSMPRVRGGWGEFAGACVIRCEAPACH